MKHSFFKTLSILLLLCISSFCFAQKDTEALIEKLEKYIEEKHIPGAMISIVRADTTVFVGGVGYANIEKGEKVTALHLFRQGSVSKSFTAMGLYKLLDSSPYTLNSPISTITNDIPFTNQWKDSNPVRIIHLLEHTTGFEDFHLHAMYNMKDETLPPTSEMVNDHANSLFTRWQPGTRKAYSNPNYIVAGHLIEAISGRSFADQIKTDILAPIGMESSGYYFKKPANLLFTQGYKREGTNLIPVPFSSINGSPAGDFSSNARDMAAFLQLMMRKDSSLFSAEEYDRIESPKSSLAAKNGLEYGYGLGNYTIWKNGHLFYGHGGQIDGYAARYIYSREADLGVAIAINRNGDANAVVDLILEELLGEFSKAPESRKTEQIPNALKEKFSGFFEFKSPKNNLLAFSDRMFAGIKLDFQDDYIVTRSILGKAKDTLYYAGNNQFYYNQEGSPSIILIDAADKPVLWINDNFTEMESHTRRLIIFFGLLLSILFMLGFMLHSLVWLVRKRLKKKENSATNHLILLGAGACMILMLVGFGITVSDPKSTLNMSFSALIMVVSSYALVVLSFGSIYRWFKLPAGKKAFRLVYIFTSVGAMMISIYLWDIGFVGLQLWSY